MGKDLRQYIEFLENHYPDQIFRIKTEVDPEFEVTAILNKLEREGKYPALIFENVKGSLTPLVTNIHASFSRLAMAIGLPENANIEEFVNEYSKREDNPLQPEHVQSGPVKEVVLKGDEVDLSLLPILKYHEQDAGKYITIGQSVMIDPDTKERNVGIYRLMIKGKNKMGIQVSETAHGNYIMKKYRNRREPMEFAVVIGHHPAFHLGCLSFTPYSVDEFTIAGSMLGEPLKLVKCETIDSEVPADAEIVLECVIPPDEFEAEAPFGEYPGTYGPERNNPVVYVKAITMRRDAYYQSCFVGHPDNLLLSGVTRCSQILRTVRIASPTVRAVNVPLSGRCRFICYIAMDKLIEGDPKNAAMAAFAADPFLKYVFVVDSDVNIMSDTEVLHAVATRLRADTDVFMVKHSRGSPLDPASYDPKGGSHIVTKVGIDATRKANYPDEIDVPGTEEIDLKKYLK